MITFVVWKWKCPTYRTTFYPAMVNTFQAMLQRNYAAPHRLICITDDAEGVECETFPLWKDHNDLANPSGRMLPSCYRRLKIFSPDTTAAMGIEEGERVISVDLDVVMCSDLIPLFERDEPFVGWKGIGTYRPVVYNGSLFMFRAGNPLVRFLWDDFDPIESPKRTREARFFGSDQAWVSFKLDGSAPGWDIEDGVYSYARDVHLKSLPDNARFVFFNGKRKPWERQVQQSAPWITRHWRA